MIPFGSKSVTLSMLIDLLTSTCRSTQVKIYMAILVWSHQLTSDLKSCLLFQKCLRWSSLKAVSVSTSVICIGGLRGSTATSDLVWRVNSESVWANGFQMTWLAIGSYKIELDGEIKSCETHLFHRSSLGEFEEKFLLNPEWEYKRADYSMSSGAYPFFIRDHSKDIDDVLVFELRHDGRFLE